MPIEEDWSDSDEDDRSEVETPVLLGVPDGPIDNAADTADAAVSRIGGHPAFLPAREPAFESSHCKVCDQPMELLVQMWCPFENSPMDRALYVWGCARAKCQSKDGSVRAWRGLRYNEKYATKLKEKLARKEAKEKQKAKEVAAKQRSALKGNPFSLGGGGAPGPFGLGDQLFGGAPTPSVPSTPEKGDESDESDEESDASESSDESLLTALASTTLEDSPWSSAPAYPPLYLSTLSEYIPPPPKAKLPSGVQVDDEPPEGKKGKGDSFSSEAYENSLDTDHVFDRFNKRVGYEGSQCIRYELNGSPLPFASDAIFDQLFPVPPAPPLPVTKAAFTVVPPVKRTYKPSGISPCPHCNSPRIFEVQLMPNLINVLKSQWEGSDDAAKSKMTDEERRKAVEAALKDKSGDAKRGMEWGTCMVFSCEKDCRVEAGGTHEAKDVWREEAVLIQWDM
ncbi:hypothetical protein PC9H_006292 [Pleurotus ostreatus]|uniref:Programmed cell death protein 2 C-terminal domain-containing protein n=1 Tax=Pleurotus ostreatus TaxID=5322 RepID=A0A8H6ZTI4_PLEOS|nr:uncharacterized protein PC9H_006292 [Pleurotus ostreatus]KAF7430584.1 hypothetical protein PC9H_006292 [Pleurotus ostreatus]KAJ8694881.1 hypothetical protein PTI98_007520 [Pleurotus ostreatus]